MPFKRPPLSPQLLSLLPPSNRFFNRVTRANQFLHLLIEARGEWSLSLGKEDAKMEEEGGDDSSRDLRLVGIAVEKEEWG